MEKLNLLLGNPLKIQSARTDGLDRSMARGMLFTLDENRGLVGRRASDDQMRRCKASIASHEQASFSLAVPGPLGGGRAFLFNSLLQKTYEKAKKSGAQKGHTTRGSFYCPDGEHVLVLTPLDSTAFWTANAPDSVMGLLPLSLRHTVL